LQTSITTAELQSARGSVLYVGIFSVFGLLLFRRKPVSNALRRRILLTVALAALGAAAGCGGKGGSTSQTLTTAPGTYNLTITSTSGTIVQMAPWTVVVQ